MYLYVITLWDGKHQICSRNISHHIAEVYMICVDVGVKLGVTSGWGTPVNLSFPSKMNMSVVLNNDVLRKLSLPAGTSKCQASQPYFPVDFSSFSLI